MPFLRSNQQRAGLLVVVLGLAILMALLPFASGLLGIAVLYVVCAPLHRRLAAHVPERLSALLVTLGALVLILLPGGILMGTLLTEAPATLRGLQESDIFRQVARYRIAGMDVGAQLATAGGTVVTWVSAQAFAFLGTAARGALSLVIAFFGLYYLLLTSGRVWEAVRAYIPFGDHSTEQLRERFHRVTEATLLGTAVIAAVQGVIVGVGFWAVGLPSAAFWGTMTGLASVIPMMGAGIVWIPGVAVLAVQQQWLAALGLAAFGAVASTTDNFVRMAVYRRVSNIHPMATLIGAFAGLKYFGLLGVLLGPLAIAYFFELLSLYREEYGVRPAAPADSPLAEEPVLTA